MKKKKKEMKTNEHNIEFWGQTNSKWVMSEPSSRKYNILTFHVCIVKTLR